MEFLLNASAKKYSSSSKAHAETARRKAALLKAQKSRELDTEKKLTEFREKKRIAERAKSLVNGAVLAYESSLSYAPGVMYDATLRALPVTGLGDKITLPQSVLESCFKDGAPVDGPMCFRVAVEGGWSSTEHDYVSLVADAEKIVDTAAPDEGDAASDDASDDTRDDASDSDSDTSSDMEGEKQGPRSSRSRSRLFKQLMTTIQPLRFRSVTHGGIVEFTAEEGTVGIPRRVSEAIFRGLKMPFKPPANHPPDDTTGQPIAPDAKNCFPVPSLPLRITLCKLPKGTNAILVPTEDAMKGGFGSLPDVKLVLEQSLGRTRTTLSVGDRISTWHRGKEFEMWCKGVEPGGGFGGGICVINTDVEVDIGYEHVEGAATTAVATTAAATTKTKVTTPTLAPDYLTSNMPSAEGGGITLQFRTPSGATQKGSFDETTTITSIYKYVHVTVLKNEGNKPFQLVGGYPRRTYEPSEKTLGEEGLRSEQFMIKWM